MTNPLTITILDTIKADIDAAIERRDDDAWADAEARLAGYADSGEPADQAQADECGPDYICALDDGRVVAWGRDYVAWPGRVAREIVVL